MEKYFVLILVLFNVYFVVLYGERGGVVGMLVVTAEVRACVV